MPREISDQTLDELHPSGEQAMRLLSITNEGFPSNKSVEFWDGALWAIQHFCDISDSPQPLIKQLGGGSARWHSPISRRLRIRILCGILRSTRIEIYKPID
jgi:hypothetical protein